MSKWRAAFIILVDSMLIIALVMIYYIDQMVNGTLYYYGLLADQGWMQPYFLLSRVCAIVIIVALFVISFVELPTPIFAEKKEQKNQFLPKQNTFSKYLLSKRLAPLLSDKHCQKELLNNTFLTFV